MNSFTRNATGLVAAALTTSTIGSIFSTQSVISSLQELSIVVPIGTRLSMTVNDMGILPSLIPITLICFIVGFAIAAVCLRFIGGNRAVWHVVAGATALMMTLLIMKAVLLVTPIAGARTLLGLLSFGLAGAIGGGVYSKLTTPKAIILSEVQQ